MKKVLSILLIKLFLLFSVNTYAQFFKKKNKGNADKSGVFDKTKKRDAFSGKNAKGPNIVSSNGPRTTSKSKLYQHSISRKKMKRGRKRSVFSSKKKRYGSFVNGPKGKSSSSSQQSSGGRKSGKGRKKIK